MPVERQVTTWQVGQQIWSNFAGKPVARRFVMQVVMQPGVSNTGRTRFFRGFLLCKLLCRLLCKVSVACMHNKRRVGGCGRRGWSGAVGRNIISAPGGSAYPTS